MKEYIEREAVLNRLEQSMRWCENELEIGEFKRGCMASLRDEIGNIKHSEVIPSADVEEVRHGEWEYYTIGVTSYRECSVCGENSPSGFKSPYCPNCGAKMDGGKE